MVDGLFDGGSGVVARGIWPTGGKRGPGLEMWAVAWLDGGNRLEA